MKDEIASVLPPALRRFAFVRAVLEPPARETGSARELYPIRMTLALVSVFLFAAQAPLLALNGETDMALALGLGGLPLMLATLLMVRAGWPRLAIDFGMTLTFALQMLFHFVYGAGSGTWLYSIAMALAAYQVHAPEDWPHRLAPITFAAIGCMLPIAFPDLPVARRLDAAQLHVIFAVNVVGVFYTVAVVSSHAAAVRDHVRDELQRERDRADALLRNILPDPIVPRLKAQPGVIADAFDDVTVVFCDLVGFTPLSARLPSEQLVLLLNEVFSAFDALATQHGLEKIKTIGDAYMVVGGVPEPREHHAEAAVRMALDMRAAVAAVAERSGHALEVRIGIHSGPVVAGVIGVHKFAYDLWGDTVNTASRMESHGAPGAIQITEATRSRLPESFDLEERGAIEVKGKGTMRTWFVRG